MKRTGLKRIAAMFLAVLFVVAMFSMTASADARISAHDKGSITVTNVTDNATATAYKIMNVKYDYDANQPADPEYFWADEVKDFIKNNYPQYINADNSVNEENYTQLNTSADNAKSFFADLAANVKNGTIVLTGSANGAGNTTISNLEIGTYLVLIEGGVKIYQPIAVNVIPKYNDATGNWEIDNQTITDTKSTLPEITKAVDVKNITINTKATYTIDATIPSYPANATANSFVVSDKLPTGLTYNGDIKVYGMTGDVPSELTANTHYTLTTGSADVDYTISFKYDQIKTYTKVRIVYSATANKGIVLGVTGNTNTAYLNYNNSPYNTSSWTEKTANAKIYSFGFDITKVAKEDNNTTLSGAEFELRDTADGAAYSLVKTADGKYRVADATDVDTVTTVAVDTNGNLIIDGLKAGKYYLKETKAPAGGYRVPSKAFEIEIKDDNNDGKEDVSGTAYAEVKIENSKGFELPSTGGMGTIMFTVGGIVLIALGFGLLLVIRKRRAA